MPINVKHSTDMGTLGPLAFTSAYNRGKRERAVQDRRFDLRQREQQMQQDRFNKRLAYRRQESQADREFRREMQEMQQDQILERKELAHDLTRQSQEFEQRQTKDLLEFKYTQKQKQQMQQYADALDFIEQSDEYSEAEKQQLRRNIQAKMHGIKPQPQLRTGNAVSGKEQEFQQETVKGPNGALYAKNSQGEWDQIDDTDVVTNEDRISAWKEAREMVLEMKEEDSEGEGATTFTEKDVKKTRRLQRQILGLDEQSPDSGGGATGQPTGQADTSAPDVELKKHGELELQKEDLAGLPAEKQQQFAENWNKQIEALDKVKKRLKAFQSSTNHEKSPLELEQEQQLRNSYSEIKKNVKDGLQQLKQLKENR